MGFCRIRSWLPLLGCALIAFAAAVARGGREEKAPADGSSKEGVVARVGGAVLTESELARRMRETDPCDGRPCADPDREREEGIRAWAHEELMYQEGLRQGLDKTDPVVRRRIVTAVYENEIMGRYMNLRPGEADLRAFHGSSPDLFRRPDTAEGYRVTLVFPEGTAREEKERVASAVADAMGAGPESLRQALLAIERKVDIRVPAACDHAETRRDVERVSGKSVVDAYFSDQALAGVVRVDQGTSVHLVRAMRVTPGTLPLFETIRDDVEREYCNETCLREYRKLLASLGDRFGMEGVATDSATAQAR